MRMSRSACAASGGGRSAAPRERPRSGARWPGLRCPTAEQDAAAAGAAAAGSAAAGAAAAGSAAAGSTATGAAAAGSAAAGSAAAGAAAAGAAAAGTVATPAAYSAATARVAGLVQARRPHGEPGRVATAVDGAAGAVPIRVATKDARAVYWQARRAGRGSAYRRFPLSWLY